MLRGRYRLTGTLELGRAATTYRAEEIETGRAVTIKVFHEIGRNDWSRLETLHRSTPSGAARLELPSAFLAVHDCDLADDGRLFLVTELVQGPTVADLLRQAPPLAPRRALELAMWIGEGLEVVLNLGLLDLPLAPGDVIVAHGDRLKLRRSDVPILRRLGLGDQLATIEAPDRDPRYASPEELAKLPPSERSVIYRYGVLVYALLCGHPPFDGTTPADLRRQARRRPARLRDRHRALPASLDRLISRMVDPDPLARPVALTAILNELWEASCRLRSETPATAVATSSASVASPASAGHSRTRPWALVGLPIVVLSSAFLAGPHLVRAPNAPVSAPAPVQSTADPPAGAQMVTPALVPVPVTAPPRPAGPPAAPAPRRAAATPVEPEATDGRAASTPPSQPAVAPPPVRPIQPAPENPRAADPTAIIEWLVRDGSRPSE